MPGNRWKGIATFAGAAAGLAGLLLAGCLTDSDDGPRYKPIDVSFLRFESPLAAAGTADSIDIGFCCLFNGCWHLEEITVDVTGHTIVVDGLMKDDHDPDEHCPAALAYGLRRIPLPPLDAGTYVLRACRLEDTLVVQEGEGPRSPRLVFKGTPHRIEGDRAIMDAAGLQVCLSGLPEEIPEGTVRIWADESSPPDSCDAPPWGYDYFASVRRLSAYSP